MNTKNYLTIVLLAISINVSAQKCDYLVNEKDEFTGAQKLETWGKLIREFTGSNANLILRKIDDGFYLLLNYNVQSPKAMVIGSTDKLMLKLEGDSVLNFSPTEIATGTLQTLNGITTTQIKVSYLATREQIETLSKYSITKVRVYFTDGYREHETKTKNTIEIKNAASCLLK